MARFIFHPYISRMLQKTTINPLPAVDTLTPDEIRESRNPIITNELGSPEPVVDVKDYTIPAKNGSIKVRMYTPDIKEFLPVLVYSHGGGWVIGKPFID